DFGLSIRGQSALPESPSPPHALGGFLLHAKSLRPIQAVVYSVVFCLMAFAVPATGQQVRQGIYRGMPVTYVMKDGRAIFQGDIVLEKVHPIDPQQAPPPSYGVSYSQFLWLKVGSQFQIPYIIDGASGDLTNLNAAISQFNSTFSNIQFVARSTQTDYVD